MFCSGDLLRHARRLSNARGVTNPAGPSFYDRQQGHNRTPRCGDPPNVYLSGGGGAESAQTRSRVGAGSARNRCGFGAGFGAGSAQDSAQNRRRVGAGFSAKSTRDSAQNQRRVGAGFGAELARFRRGVDHNTTLLRAPLVTQRLAR